MVYKIENGYIEGDPHAILLDTSINPKFALFRNTYTDILDDATWVNQMLCEIIDM